jgi:hypothetical protein
MKKIVVGCKFATRFVVLFISSYREVQSLSPITHQLSRYESNNGGTFSTKYFTMASGPRSTCRPVGIAWYLMSGTIDLAND